MNRSRKVLKTFVQRKTTKRPPGLKIKTKVRAAGINVQHNEALHRA